MSYTALSQFSLLHVGGPDSERFLQGQLTCDVVALQDKQWTLGACCTAKGRMVANFVIARQGEDFWLRLPNEQVAALKQHLSKYIVFFKAKMHEHNQDYRVAGFIPKALTPTLLTQAQPWQETEQGMELTWPDGRKELWLNQAASPEAGNNAWALADINQGLVWVTASTQEAWLPQNINWPQQGGVSFKKGCYTGQEIVARLQFLGTSKKQVVRIESAECLELAPLQKLEDNQGKSIGEVLAWLDTTGLALVNAEPPLSQCQAQGQELQISAALGADE